MKRLRQRIDEIDARIIRLLDERAECARDIGQIKQKANAQVYAPHREKQILEELILKYKDKQGGFPLKALINIYREIIAESRVLQKSLRISYLGPEASFTHLAATKQFSDPCSYASASSIAQVFREVTKGRSDYGVVPVENSTEGMVSHTLDMFFESECKICAELLMEISHHLLSREDSLANIKAVYSHPQALSQCETWLEEHVPQAELKEVASTAVAGLIAKDEPGSAAIASSMAAEIYGLGVLESRIEDRTDNTTRFFVIGSEAAKPSDDAKTSVMFSIKDRVGALHDMLVPFKTNSINLTKIESRPSRFKAWHYVFFVELEGHGEDPVVQKTLADLAEQCLFLKVLGSYPAARVVFSSSSNPD